MKKSKNLYEQIYDFDNLYQAYLEARKCKRYRDEVLDFTANLEENLITIQNELIYQTYTVGRYREFYIIEPKKRLIMALPFRDRVVQWAIYRVINPIVSKGFITDSYACITGRGSHAAIQRIQYWLRLVNNKPEKYNALKMDIEKFFFRIPHEVIIESLSMHIDDERVIWLFSEIICNSDTPFGFPLGKIDVGHCDRVHGIGQPVGSLLSQMDANLVMNRVDQFIKRDLRVHFYMRYMDDMLILGSDKRELRSIKEQVEQFLESNLRLNLNNKTSIRPVSLGIEFCGYKVWNTHIKLRKSTALRMKRRLKVIQKRYANGEIDLDRAKRTLASYNGMTKHCNSYNLRRTIYGEPQTDFSGWFGLKRNKAEETATE